jgi:hypothetical protein
MASRLRLAVLASLAIALTIPAAASAQNLADPLDQWLPSPDNASWTYRWDSAFSPQPTLETYTLKRREGSSFRLAWEDTGGAQYVMSEGEIDYRRTDLGLVNTNWSSTPPPPQFPILCASADHCANSLAGVHYMLIWGNRSPVLLEPLVKGARWSSLGGAGNDVSSTSRYVGRSTIKVPAFPKPVLTAKVQTQITQAGALGDPYGSGLRTVYWMRGVGPVRIEFRHGGGQVSNAELTATSLVPRALPSDASYLPLNRGNRFRLRWRNSKHMKRPSTQDFTVAEVVNNTARVDVKNVSGPIRVRGSYLFSTRLTGIRNLSGTTRASSLARFPPLGPRSAPRADRRHFFTPLDLMVFGFNPILPAYPTDGERWTGTKRSSEYESFGVTGTSEILGTERVKTHQGRVRVLVVRSRLVQRGFPFGSGTRTSYFQPGRGLVKLVFRHADGSVSTVDRIR